VRFLAGLEIELPIELIADLVVAVGCVDDYDVLIWTWK